MIQTDGVSISVIKYNQEPAKSGPTLHIYKLTTEKLQNTTGKCMFIDPVRRDMLYCMREIFNKAKNEDYLYRYTSNQRAKNTKARRFKKLRQDTKLESVKECEIYLSKYPASTVDAAKFSEYLKARSEVKAQHNHTILPFRKMKLSSVINKKQSDTRLAKTLQEKFGKDSVLVMGSWSAANTKFHEPIRGKGIRRMLKKHRFLVYLIDEHKTSSLCPKCKYGKLETSLKVSNSRPIRRAERPVVECHRLLRCTNQKDLAAALYFEEIMISHRQAFGRPLRFKRQTLKRSSSTSNSNSQHKHFRSTPPDDGHTSS
ncbi:hypothetical protein BCV72DRAFT_257089 [Rhizopus microsporus var. microsporus]|uniref:Uncharacterized protein n=1 Tax=Rhizopus microsporus var. microsporus TaxID=86635 RepID=A0A1X0QYL8_RHIZD|nr:hypothetical protein BCV72DRAFT_257089 [Rhizopus microsporus var. microsporus]